MTTTEDLQDQLQNALNELDDAKSLNVHLRAELAEAKERIQNLEKGMKKPAPCIDRSNCNERSIGEEFYSHNNFGDDF